MCLLIPSFIRLKSNISNLVFTSNQVIENLTKWHIYTDIDYLCLCKKMNGR